MILFCWGHAKMFAWHRLINIGTPGGWMSDKLYETPFEARFGVNEGEASHFQ
ncbi:hypothetical protein X741_00875 [Mesorhizobium sp. LNHC229A00]|nr:hypothetical protein X741_00875 [Mesorhizobium sp. LNHC229A00]